MPQKMKFFVVGATGEAQGYSAKNLEYQSPRAPGWQTQRFCVYPQEVVFRLYEPARIKLLQILSHQFMICSKIEFYVGMNESPESFNRLGYVNFSTNEKSDFKFRELKSIHVDAEGLYIRLLVHKNHFNRLNLYNQVGIVAFSALGDPINAYQQAQQKLTDNYFNVTDFVDDNFKESDFISPLDDLACNIYQDPEVAEIIRRLDLKKKMAVMEEKFDMAKTLKQAIADLRRIGEKLARYEFEKRNAVEKEDYDLAKSKKTQMDEYRLKVYQQLQKHRLLEDAGVPPYLPEEAGYSQSENQEDLHQSSGICPVYEMNAPSIFSELIESTQVELLESSRPFVEQCSDDFRREHGSVAYDEKIIPTLDKQKHPHPFLDEMCSVSATNSSEQQGPSEPEPLSERNLSEARSVIDLFDIPLVSGAYSKTWSFRENALLSVHEILSNLPQSSSKDELHNYVKAAVFLIKKGIKDNVHSVYQAAFDLLEMICVDFMPKHKLCKSEIAYAITQTLPLLIHKCGETAARSRSCTLDFIERLSGLPTVHQLHLIPHHATPPFNRDIAHRLALSRVELMKRLVNKYGLEPPELTVDSAMKFLVAALEHPSGAVREEAAKLVYQVYKICGESVKQYLPEDSHTIRKSTLYRSLFDGFDKIDGKLTQSEIKTQLQAEEIRKKREIHDLQAQVDQLKAVNKAAEVSSTQKETKQAKKVKKASLKPHVDPEDSVVSSDRDSAQKDEASIDKMCIFCGERDDGFTEEGLDMHYWQHCPMLKQCEHCKQVVEIAGYSEHLVTECNSKDKFAKCTRCTEAVLKIDLEKHIAEKKCAVVKASSQEHCPLCHRNIPKGEESWKQHLIGSKKDSCQENPRREISINRLKAKAEQQRNSATTSNTKKSAATKTSRN